MLHDLAPHAGGRKLTQFTPIEWKDHKGRAWRGLLGVPAKPDPSGAFPLLIQTHGYDDGAFFAEGASTTAFPGRAAVARGFVVLAIDESLDALFDDRKLEGPGALMGYRSAIRVVGTRVPIDPRRVGIIGWSRTSYHVKYALTHAPALFAAAVCADGVDYGYFQYLAYLGMDGFDMGEEFARTYGGLPWRNWSQWMAESPGFRLDKVNAPVLVQANSLANVIGEWEFYAGLKRLGKPTELLIFPAGAHLLKRPGERMRSTGATLDWMDFWLNGRESDIPAKRARFSRWRGLAGDRRSREHDPP